MQLLPRVRTQPARQRRESNAGLREQG